MLCIPIPCFSKNNPFIKWKKKRQNCSCPFFSVISNSLDKWSSNCSLNQNYLESFLKQVSGPQSHWGICILIYSQEMLMLSACVKPFENHWFRFSSLKANYNNQEGRLIHTNTQAPSQTN